MRRCKDLLAAVAMLDDARTRTMQLVHDLHLDSAFASAVARDRVDATGTAVILLLPRRGASVFHRLGAATLLAFHGYLQGVQCFHSVQ
jgi:hypothetical protein